MDVRSLWNFSDPAASQRVFETELKTAQGDLVLELKCQIARTYSLRKDFSSCHAVLDKISDECQDNSCRSWACYRLERGRAFNSAGNPDAARPLFTDATKSPFEDLAIDGYHMLAIVSPPDQAYEINQSALNRATESSSHSAQRWRASLLNNMGWNMHDLGQFSEALQHFKDATASRQQMGDAEGIHIALWCEARCLRSLERHQEAIEILISLDNSDPNVSEELEANMQALGQL
jgi:tetratricopeptide (TPR) repeat protein